MMLQSVAKPPKRLDKFSLARTPVNGHSVFQQEPTEAQEKNISKIKPISIFVISRPKLMAKE